MRFRVIFALGALIALICPPIAVADSTAPIIAPTGISSDIWNTFYAKVFTGSALKNKLLRWSGTGPGVSVFGNVTSQDANDLSLLSKTLKNYCSYQFPNINVSSSTEGNVNIYIVPRDQFTKYIPNAPTDTSSYLSYNYYETGSLRKVTIVVDSDLASGPNRSAVLIYRLMQSMGFWGLSDNSTTPLFKYGTFTGSDLSKFDKEIYTLFCNSTFSSGDTFETFSKSINSLLNKIPNQVPMLKSKAEVNLTSNTTVVKIELTSLAEIWSAGLTTLRWKLQDSTGSIIDSSDIINRDNRLINSWEIVLNGLASNTNYKFLYAFENAVGEGRTENVTFKTEKVIEAPVAEKAEQSITLFTEVSTIKLSQKVLEIEAASSSGLDLVTKSLSPSICEPDGLTVSLKKAGVCRIQIEQLGDDDFLAADPLIVTFTIETSKVTITCIKGKASKKITGTSPKCPAGYKQK